MDKNQKIIAIIVVFIVAIVGAYAAGTIIGNALSDDAEYDYEVTNSGTNQVSTSSGSLFTHTAQTGYKYIIVKVVAKTIDAENGLYFYYSDFKLKCSDGNEYTYAYGLGTTPSGNAILNGNTCTLSIAYEVPTTVSASSIVPHHVGVQFKHNSALIGGSSGGSGGSNSSSYDGTYRISAKYVDDFIDAQPATILADRDYALVYITVNNNTSSSMNYISQFSLVTTSGTSYTPLASYSKDVGYSSSKTIAPGSSATYGLYYQVPTGFSTSQIASINYTGFTYSLSYISY